MIGPFDQCQRLLVEVLVGPEGKKLRLAAEPVGVQVIDGPPASVLVSQDERGLTTSRRSTPHASAIACTSGSCPRQGAAQRTTVPSGRTSASSTPRLPCRARRRRRNAAMRLSRCSGHDASSVGRASRPTAAA